MLDLLRSLMRADQRKRDDFANALLRVDSETGNLLAELIDLSSIDPGWRRQMTRVLGGTRGSTNPRQLETPLQCAHRVGLIDPNNNDICQQPTVESHEVPPERFPLRRVD